MTHNLMGCYANVWVRQKIFTKVGEEIGGHKHKYDHLSILARGEVQLRVDDTIKVFKAPTFIVIPKDKEHNATALTDDVLWYCVFAHRDIDGEVFDSELNAMPDMQCHNLEPKLKSLDQLTTQYCEKDCEESMRTVNE